jgi:hypothetical protein
MTDPLQSVSEYIDELKQRCIRAEANFAGALRELETLRSQLRTQERAAREAEHSAKLLLGRQASDSIRQLEAEKLNTTFAAGYGKELCTLLGRCLPWVQLHGDDRKEWARDVAKILELSGHA